MMDDVMWSPGSPDNWIDGLYDLICWSICVLFVNEYCIYLVFFFFSVPTNEFRGCMSNSVELCPMPLGMPAVRYMEPTERLFLASLAAFITSTVTPSSAKFCTPALARAPSSHNRKWRLWLTAKWRKGTRGWDGSRMLNRWNAFQCQWNTTEPQPDGELISTMESVCISMAAAYFLQLNR